MTLQELQVLFSVANNFALFQSLFFCWKVNIKNYSESQSQSHLHLHASEQQQNILNWRIWEFIIFSMEYVLFQEENMVFSGGVDSKIVQFRQITSKVNTRMNW